MLATTKYACRRMATAVAASSDLFETSVTFKNSAGDNINLKAVFQDTLPSGSSIGTVIGLHGAPGSHLDFKYISPLLAKKSIRFIGINYPGFGVTPYDDLLKWNNVERHDYVLAILEHLKLHKNLVLLGHSRGTENAIMLGAERQAHGIALLNPTGLRIHRGIKPYWFIQTCNRIYNAPIPGLRLLLHPFFFQVYKYVKIKVPDGQMAAICMQTMENVALGGQKAYIEKINNSQTKVLFCYAGKDWLIENEISQDCAKAFNIDHFECETTEKDEEAALLEQISPSLKKKGCSVFFKADGHFLQKARAEFVSNAIEKMLTGTSSKL